jgi:hypothetical protein
MSSITEAGGGEYSRSVLWLIGEDLKMCLERVGLQPLGRSIQ